MVGISLFGLGLLIDVVLSSLRKQNQFFILSLPRLDEAFELKPPNVIGTLRIDTHRDAFLAIDEPVDDGYEGIKAVHFLEEGFRVCMMVVEEVR